MPSLKPYLPAIILCVICLVTTGLLSLTYELTRAERTRQSEIAANTNRLALFPDASGFETLSLPDGAPAGLSEITRAEDANGQVMGYLFVASKRGYGGQVPAMVAVDAEGTLVGVRVLGNSETPGLGKKVEQTSFTGQFVGKLADTLFALDTSNNQLQPLDAISGATISSRAVMEAVNTAIEGYLALDKEGQ
ncbi:MAG: RnfABCDGE type electron transport complex subunit G [Clostridiaceae bacterium]|nr:RnfABCDGE type electron transport complex subunit G [Clostridiaceae bacterium]